MNLSSLIIPLITAHIFHQDSNLLVLLPKTQFMSVRPAAGGPWFAVVASLQWQGDTEGLSDPLISAAQNWTNTLQPVSDFLPPPSQRYPLSGLLWAPFSAWHPWKMSILPSPTACRMGSSQSPLLWQGGPELRAFPQWAASDVAESWQNMRSHFACVPAVFRSTPAIKASSSLSIILLSRQPFCSLRSIQSGPAVGRSAVSEWSSLFWWKICSVKLIRLNSKCAVGQMSSTAAFEYHSSQSVGETESCVSALCDEIQWKFKKKD